jgi:hypothetical protein
VFLADFGWEYGSNLDTSGLTLRISTSGLGIWFGQERAVLATQEDPCTFYINVTLESPSYNATSRLPRVVRRANQEISSTTGYFADPQTEHISISLFSLVLEALQTHSRVLICPENNTIMSVLPYEILLQICVLVCIYPTVQCCL